MAKNATKLCKYCKTEIPHDAKICPQCRSKVKGGKLKWVILTLVLVFALVVAMGGGGDSSEKNPASDTATTSVVNVAEIEYTPYKCTELFDDLKGNALSAEKRHQDEYIELKGYLQVIDSDGAYICLGAGEDDYTYMLDDIQCYLRDGTQREQVMDMQKGQYVCLKGQITSIGELMGYSVSVHEIVSAS